MLSRNGYWAHTGTPLFFGYTIFWSSKVNAIASPVTAFATAWKKNSLEKEYFSNSLLSNGSGEIALPNL
jgi:hypothetical protein